MTAHRTLIRSLLGLALLVAPACASDRGFSPLAEWQRLALARERWIARAPASYAFTMQLACFCAERGPMRVSVVNGAVVSVRPVGSDQELDERYRGPYRPIPDLFGVVSSAIDRPAYRIRAEYDPRFGYPADVFIDFQRNVADEEYGFLVRDVTFP